MVNWRVYGQETLACVLQPAELPGVFRKRFSVPPGEAAVVIRNGQVENVFSEKRVEIANAADWLLNLFGAAHQVQVLFVATAPFGLTYYFGSVEQDSAGHGGECTVTLRVDPQKAAALMGAMAGRHVLARADLHRMVEDQVLSASLAATGSAGPDAPPPPAVAADLRRETERVLQHTAPDWGMDVASVEVRMAATGTVQAALHEKSQHRQALTRKFEITRREKEAEREAALARTRLDNVVALKKLQAQGETELARIYAAAEFGLRQMADDRRIAASEVDARIRQIEAEAAHKQELLQLESERCRQLAQLEIDSRQMDLAQAARLAKIDADDREMWEMVKMKNAMAAQKHELAMQRRRQELEAAFHRQKARLESEFQQRMAGHEESAQRMGMQERVLDKYLSAGHADSEVMQTFLKETTKQQYAGTSDAKVRALFRSEKAAAKPVPRKPKKR